MTIEERLKRIEERLGIDSGDGEATMYIGCWQKGAIDDIRDFLKGTGLSVVTADIDDMNAVSLKKTPKPKQATIKFNLNPDRAETLMEALEGVEGVTVTSTPREDVDPLTGAGFIRRLWTEITITGPAE